MSFEKFKQNDNIVFQFFFILQSTNPQELFNNVFEIISIQIND